MRLPIRTLTAAALALALQLPSPASAAGDYDSCTGFIDSVPATITTQGTWCLRRDLSTSITSGVAITVANNNVTIDCNDFKLGGLAAGLATRADGIQSTNRLNITVRHCNIRGFLHGIKLGGPESGGHVVEDNRAQGNTHAGVSVDGDGSVVRRNLVLDTGGSTVDRIVRGISTDFSVDILDNTVSGVLPGVITGVDDTVDGIFTYQNRSASVSGNKVRGLVPPAEGIARGIFNQSPNRISLVGNHVVGDASPGSVGLSCSNAISRAKDNVVNGFAIAIINCGDDGNISVP
jgi:hypothetical protein